MDFTDNPFELDKHDTDSDSLREKMAEDSDEVISRFAFGPNIFSKSSGQIIKLDIIGDDVNSDTVKYNTPEIGTHITKSVLKFELPSVRVKDKYKDKFQIRWPSNLSNVLVEKSSLFIGKQEFFYGRSARDIFSSFFISDTDRPYVNKCAGNIPILTNWSTKLPFWEDIEVKQFWPYCDSRTPMKINCFETSNYMRHEFKLHRKISDIIQMRVKNDKNEWEIIKADMDKITVTSCIRDKDTNVIKELVRGSENINQPMMIAKISSEEEDEIDPNCSKKYGYIYYDMHAIKNSTKLSKDKFTVYNLELKYNHLVVGFVVLAENMNSKKINIYSNYTDNTSSPEDGYNPVKSITFVIHKESRLKKFSTKYMSNSMLTGEMAGHPSRQGYNICLLNAYSLCDLDIEGGIKFSKEANPNVEILIDELKLYPEDIIIDEDTTEDIINTTSNQYLTSVVLIVKKKITFDETSKGSKKFKVDDIM